MQQRSDFCEHNTISNVSSIAALSILCISVCRLPRYRDRLPTNLISPNFGGKVDFQRIQDVLTASRIPAS